MKSPESLSRSPAEAAPLAGPKLRFINQAFSAVRSHETNKFGEEISWRDLPEKVQPYASGIELSDNIRDVVFEFVSKKVPALKEGASSLKDLPDKKILEALAHNWFEGVGEEIGGKRRELLLAVAAHAVKKIENYTYKETLRRASEKNLADLGLDDSTRTLLIDVLDTSIKADPMYIRFMAYAQLSGKPPEEVSLVGFHVRGEEAPRTLASLFPHESQFLAGRFETMANGGGAWEKRDGGPIFKAYLLALSAFYSELDPAQAHKLHETIQSLYLKLLTSDFPIVITPATEGYYKEPYLDPELKVSVRTPDARKEEANWATAQQAMSESLGELDASGFAETMRAQPIRSAHVFGGFGVNITFNAVAQEHPSILIFLNEQMRAYDREFCDFMLTHVERAPELPANFLEPEERVVFEKISRTDTVLHELSHGIFPDGSPEAKRLGRKPLTILDEVRAEICFRPLVPSVIEKGGLEGTKEEWATGMLASSLQMFRDQPPGDPYYCAAAYPLNRLLGSGAVIVENGRLRISSLDLYFNTLKNAAEDVLALYRDASMTERKATTWIQENCEPNAELQAFRGVPKVASPPHQGPAQR